MAVGVSPPTLVRFEATLGRVLDYPLLRVRLRQGLGHTRRHDSTHPDENREENHY